jgi:mRNA interferase MazF
LSTAQRTAPNAAGKASWAPDSGDIIWLNFTPHAGKEMAGMHPFLVLSSQLFNAKTGTVVGLAMTSKAHNHAGSAGFNPFQIANKTSKGESYINVNQVSTFDWVARQAKPHPWGTVSKPILQNAKDMLNAVLGLG